MRIVNVMAASLDGRIGIKKIEGDRARQGGGITSKEDQRHLRLEIAKADAILVGASSIRANEECLDHPGRNGKYPTWIVFATRPIPKHFNFWNQNHIRRIIVCSSPIESFDESVQIHVSNDPVDTSMDILRRQNSSMALLFGGGIVNSWFYNAGKVDELVLTLAPKIVGKVNSPFLIQPDLAKSVDLTLQTSQVSENFVFLRYSINTNNL